MSNEWRSSAASPRPPGSQRHCVGLILRVELNPPDACVQAGANGQCKVAVAVSYREVQAVGFGDPNNAIDPRTVSTGVDGKPRYVVIQDDSAWSAWWAGAQPMYLPQTKPAVDSSRETVVAILLGARTNGCHDVVVRSVQSLGPELTVNHAKLRPQDGGQGGCTLPITCSTAVVVVGDGNKRVTFGDQTAR